MSGIRRKAALASAALVCNVLLMTACGDSDKATGAVTADQGQQSTEKQEAGKQEVGKQEAAGSGFDTGDGRRKPVEQTCGANDISWSTRAESQAGGYIQITARAKAGITCYLPAALPTVAFGSDGTQAGPAQKAAPRQIKLTGDTAAYAGVNPKSAKGDGGKELDSIIVAIGDDDPQPVSLPVDTVTVKKPVVTNWHTNAGYAVPLG
ncbi:DUF4232 domain-containing protein [Streptomyces sp. NPDC000594]|uniref:DUF4232 domain-containing protein n=1 Tax=Streptomyces sp. NPDC000594 TaxID=3154261 RepID=UPI0033292822